MTRGRQAQRLGVVLSIALATLAGSAGSLLFGACGPFTDVAADVFCPFVLEIFDLGITTGTTPTTYDPTSNVTRLQMAAFLSRTVDQLARRGSRRTSLGQLSHSQTEAAIARTSVGSIPRSIAFDGSDLWVAVSGAGKVARVRASDGRVLESWTAPFAEDVRVAMGRVFTTGNTEPGRLYMIDPAQPAGAATIVTSSLTHYSGGIAFDGARFWIGNNGGLPAAISIVTPGSSLPWTVTTITAGFTDAPGVLYDGDRIWVADAGGNKLLRLDSSGAILQTVTIDFPTDMVYDGANIWVLGSSLTVVRPSTGAILSQLTGNGLGLTFGGAFDGENLLVANLFNDSVSLWKAADLSPLGFFSTGSGSRPYAVQSDGVSFWISLRDAGSIARF